MSNYDKFISECVAYTDKYTDCYSVLDVKLAYIAWCDANEIKHEFPKNEPTKLDDVLNDLINTLGGDDVDCLISIDYANVDDKQYSIDYENEKDKQYLVVHGIKIKDCKSCTALKFKAIGDDYSELMKKFHFMSLRIV